MWRRPNSAQSDSRRELLQSIRFLQEVRLQVHYLGIADRLSRIAGHEPGFDLGPQARQSPGEFTSTHARHHDIADQIDGTVFVSRGKRVEPISRLNNVAALNVVALQPNQFRCGPPGGRFVLAAVNPWFPSESEGRSLTTEWKGKCRDHSSQIENEKPAERSSPETGWPALAKRGEG